MAVRFIHKSGSLAAFAAAKVKDWLKDPSLYRHHGIGVLQGYVLESEPPQAEYRLHVWHPELRLPDMTDSGLIHDHRFELQSTVLYGRIHQTVYELETSTSGAFCVWEVQNARAAEGGKGWLKLESDTRYNQRNVHTTRHRAGDSYEFGARKFHRTDVDALTITVCCKRNQRNVPARILSRFGKQPRHGFEHDQAMDAVLKEKILSDALDMLMIEARTA